MRLSEFYQVVSVEGAKFCGFAQLAVYFALEIAQSAFVKTLGSESLGPVCPLAYSISSAFRTSTDWQLL